MGFWGQEVIFAAAYLPENNIYSYHLKSGEINKLTSHKVGAFQPNFNPQTQNLTFAGFSSNGFEIYEDTVHIYEKFNPLSESQALNRIDAIAILEGGSILKDLEPLSLPLFRFN